MKREVTMLAWFVTVALHMGATPWATAGESKTQDEIIRVTVVENPDQVQVVPRLYRLDEASLADQFEPKDYLENTLSSFRKENSLADFYLLVMRLDLTNSQAFSIPTITSLAPPTADKIPIPHSPLNDYVKSGYPPMGVLPAKGTAPTVSVWLRTDKAGKTDIAPSGAGKVDVFWVIPRQTTEARVSFMLSKPVTVRLGDGEAAPSSSRPSRASNTDDTHSVSFATPTNTIELVLWYVRTNSPMERTRLLPRDELPARDNPYMEIAVPRQQRSLVSDAGDPLEMGHGEHRVVLYPDYGEIKGYDRESWLGFLPPGVSVSNASVRMWCASAGKTKLSASLKQYDVGAMVQGDIVAAQQPAWEGTGECEVTTNTLTPYSIALECKTGTNHRPYTEKQMVALMIQAETGEPCMLSTGSQGKNQAMPFSKVLGGWGEPALFKREGVAVASSVPVGQAVLTIEPGSIAQRKPAPSSPVIPTPPQTTLRLPHMSAGQSPVASQDTAKTLPPFQENVTGPNEVRVRNPNAFAVQAGIRAGTKGVDINVPANGVKSVYVSNGRYDIYFIYSDRPDALFQGDSFTLADNGVEIQIVKMVNGNYNIRQVR